MELFDAGLEYVFFRQSTVKRQVGPFQPRLKRSRPFACNGKSGAMLETVCYHVVIGLEVMNLGVSSFQSLPKLAIFIMR